MDMIQQIFLGLALASAAGLRAFLPLLGLSLASHFGYVHLNEHFAWLGSGKALGVLAVAAVAETLADKVPVVDHALDLLQTVVRPAAGALAMAGTQQHMDPIVGAALGLILGGSLAGGLHAAKGGVRLASTVTTAGLANPLLSLVEDGTSLGLTVLALVSPLLGFLLALLIVLGAWQGWRRLSRRRRAQ